MHAVGVNETRGQQAIPLSSLFDGNGVHDQRRLGGLILHLQKEDQAGEANDDVGDCESVGVQGIKPLVSLRFAWRNRVLH